MGSNNQIGKKLPRKLLRFNVDLTEHCNLNCIGCGHFSPIAKEKFIDIEIFERDCNHLSELTNKKIERLELMGGEPLLHPKLIEIMNISRKYFIGKIAIATNGILLSKQSISFWNACQVNSIDIDLTLYPIKIDLDEIKRIADQYKVSVTVKGEGLNNKKLWYHNYRDITGNQSANENFNNCQWSNNCIFLENGKLSTCVVPIKIKHFNEYFGYTFHVSDKDYIDIYTTNNISEILDFLSKPIPFCRFCLPGNEKIIQWESSKSKSTEWL